MVTVRQAVTADGERIGALCALFWPEATAEQHHADLTPLLQTGRCGSLPTAILLAEDGGSSVGFLQMGLRSHADGCDATDPVGFIEGWFVREGFRHRGIGRALLSAAEDWARHHGCREMASDT